MLIQVFSLPDPPASMSAIPNFFNVEYKLKRIRSFLLLIFQLTYHKQKEEEEYTQIFSV